MRIMRILVLFGALMVFASTLPGCLVRDHGHDDYHHDDGHDDHHDDHHDDYDHH